MTGNLITLAGSLLWIAFDLFFLYVTWYSAREWGRSSLLNAQGRITHGKIVSCRSNFNRAARYYVTYRYSVLNRHHKQVSREREQQVSWRHIKRIKKDMPVEVSYLPHNPKVAQLTGVHRDHTTRDTAMLLAALGIFLFPYFAIVWLAVFLFERFGYKIAGKV